MVTVHGRTRAQIALEHLQGLIEAMGDGPGLRHARKHLAAYASAAGCGATAEEASLRRLLVTTNDPFEARGIIERLFAVQAKKEAA
jgi:tRNA-dihydrouridine synthase B